MKTGGPPRLSETDTAGAAGTGTVLAIYGPTASGKSAVAEAVAQRIPAAVISADSAQLYRGLPILTNQPVRPTRLVAVWELDHEASVAEYQRLAHAEIDAALSSARTPVVVGGTGLYLRAALADLELPPPAQPGARMRWSAAYDRLGAERTHAILAQRDAAAAARLHPNDRRRVVRALELADVGASLAPTRDRLWGKQTRRPTLVFGLDVPPDVLGDRIERRTREMLVRGAREEARAALAQPHSSTAAKVLGLREAAELPFEEALEAIVRRTRRLASYQRKWMRRIPGLIRLDATRPPEDVADELLEMAGAGERLPAHG